MHPRLLTWLRCPACGSDLDLRPNEAFGEHIVHGTLVCKSCARVYPIQNGVPRFVDTDGYASSFSYEWGLFRRTQLDSFTGRSDSRRRLQASLNVPIEQLRGKIVLEAGCGSGRFGEVVHDAGGIYVGLDFS